MDGKIFMYSIKILFQYTRAVPTHSVHLIFRKVSKIFYMQLYSHFITMNAYTKINPNRTNWSLYSFDKILKKKIIEPKAIDFEVDKWIYLWKAIIILCLTCIIKVSRPADVIYIISKATNGSTIDHVILNSQSTLCDGHTDYQFIINLKHI